MEKTLRFSEPFVNAEHVAYVEDFRIDRRSIILNIDLDLVEVEEIDLLSLKSIVCTNVTLEKAKNIIVITVENDNFLGTNPDIDREIIQNSWQHIYDEKMLIRCSTHLVQSMTALHQIPLSETHMIRCRALLSSDSREPGYSAVSQSSILKAQKIVGLPAYFFFHICF